MPRVPASKGSSWGPCHSSDTGSAMHFNRPLPEEGLKGGSAPCQACNLATKHEPATLSEIQCSAFVTSYDQRNSFELVKKASAPWDISREIASELKRAWKGGGSEDGTGKGLNPLSDVWNGSWVLCGYGSYD